VTGERYAGRRTYGVIGGLYLLWALSAVVGMEMSAGWAMLLLAPIVAPLAQIVRPTRAGWWLMLLLLASAAIWTLVSTLRGFWYMAQMVPAPTWRWWEDGAFHALLIIEALLGLALYGVARLGVEPSRR